MKNLYYVCSFLLLAVPTLAQDASKTEKGNSLEEHEQAFVDLLTNATMVGDFLNWSQA